jgi:hypothetical protein
MCLNAFGQAWPVTQAQGKAFILASGAFAGVAWLSGSSQQELPSGQALQYERGCAQVVFPIVPGLGCGLSRDHLHTQPAALGARDWATAWRPSPNRCLRMKVEQQIWTLGIRRCQIYQDTYFHSTLWHSTMHPLLALVTLVGEGLLCSRVSTSTDAPFTGRTVGG